MRKATIFIVLSLLLVFCASPALAAGIPALPHAFYGSVTINGNPAPDGSRVSATVDQGDIIATQNPVTTAGDSFGISSPKLLVQGDIPNGATITFYVNDVEVEGATAIFEAGGGPTQVDLGVTIPRPPGPGPGAPDRTRPRISNVLLCLEGVTKTTADICWETHEKSDSQVEYWSSGSGHKFSSLDPEMVIHHHVDLTGLTPATTYRYKTMSRDKAGNLAVSDEHAFTTLGLPATFTTSNLFISPTEVTIGETVTICVDVENRGDCEGCCKTVLKINGVVEATEEVTLKAGISGEATFTTTKDVAGSYSVEVNGLSGSFTVRRVPTPTPTPTPIPTPPAPPPTPAELFNWALVGGIIAAVLVVGLGVFFWMRRRSA